MNDGMHAGSSGLASLPVKILARTAAHTAWTSTAPPPQNKMTRPRVDRGGPKAAASGKATLVR